jgi:hypothetical protein
MYWESREKGGQVAAGAQSKNRSAVVRCTYLLDVSVGQASAAEEAEDEARAIQRRAAAAELQRREVLMRRQQ